MLVGDTHGNTGTPMWMHMVFDRARRVEADRVLQLGDFGVWPGRRGEKFLDLVDKLSENAGLPFEFVDGNHEDHDQLTEQLDRAEPDGSVLIRPHIRWRTRGSRWQWAGVRFGALGGAVSVDRGSRIPGVSWWPGERPTEADLERLGPAPLDVLVTHDAPAGIDPDIPGLSHRTPTSQDVRELLRRAVLATGPRILVHGHHHIRHSARLPWVDRDESEHTGKVVWRHCRVDGFDMNEAKEKGDAWGMLLLPELWVQNGREFER